LAWESLETARVILEDYLQLINPNHSEKNISQECKERMLVLAEIHCLLAESQMEEEFFDAALHEFEKALELRRICGDSWHELAYTHFMCSICAAYSSKKDVSQQHLQDSIQLYRDRIIALLKLLHRNPEKPNEENTDDDIQNVDNKELIVLVEKILQREDLSVENREELKDLKDNLIDLLNKMDEDTEGGTMNENEKGLLNETMQTLLNLANIEENEEQNAKSEIEAVNIKSDFDGDNNNDKENNSIANNQVLNTVPFGVTTIGFNDSESAQNCDPQNIHDLGNFGNTNSKKRSFEQIETDDYPETKKIRLSNVETNGN
jgi:hypothetical protein